MAGHCFWCHQRPITEYTPCPTCNSRMIQTGYVCVAEAMDTPFVVMQPAARPDVYPTGRFVVASEGGLIHAWSITPEGARMARAAITEARAGRIVYVHPHVWCDMTGERLPTPPIVQTIPNLEGFFRSQERTRKKSDERVLPWQSSLKPGDFCWSLFRAPMQSITLYWRVEQPDPEDPPVSKNYRIFRGFSDVEPGGEYGVEHISNVWGILTASEWEMHKAAGWPQLPETIAEACARNLDHNPAPSPLALLRR